MPYTASPGLRRRPGRPRRPGTARDRVDPDFQLTLSNSNVDYLGLLDARSYLSAVDAYGSPAYSPSELATAPEVGRVAGDKVSGAALGIHLAAAGAGTARRCLAVTASRGQPRWFPAAAS